MPTQNPVSSSVEYQLIPHRRLFISGLFSTLLVYINILSGIKCNRYRNETELAMNK